MSAIDVMFTRTHDGDYIADFDCNDSDLPHNTNIFFYSAISTEELAALRAQAAESETLRATAAEQAQQLEQARR